jgi:ubiquinone/menaquinone biosynthesis C-methylase UbiE
MNDPAHRFSGPLAEEYELITLAYPDFEAFQRGLIVALNQGPAAPHILELGTGNGFTTRLLLEIPGAEVTTVDNDPAMVGQAREHLETLHAAVHIHEADALAFLQSLPAERFDAVASAFTLHNLEVSYRNAVELEIFRVLRPGGVFANADKYAPDGQERFDALVYQVERFFDAFVPPGKIDLLQRWVTHNITDQSPRFVMPAAAAPPRLEALGFENVTLTGRSHMQAVLSARKPGTPGTKGTP